MLSTKEALEADGYEVQEAVDGAAAIELLDDPSLGIAGLIIDVGLGPGPTGWEVAAIARERDPNIPVVYATGGNSAEWPIRGVQKSSLVEKPYGTDQVVSAITRLLGSH